MSMLWPIVKRCLAVPKRVAAVDDQRSYTYGQVLGGAMFLADKLDTSTAQPHIGILLPTSGAFQITLLGTWLARRAAVPLNYLLAAEELSYVIRDSGIDTIVTVRPMLAHLAGAAAGAGGEIRPPGIPPDIQLIHLETLDFSGVPPVRWPPVAHRDDLAALLYTSGTNGRPKGVMLTHGNLRSNVEAGIRHAGLSQADVFLGVLPQFHSFGFTALTLIPMVAGAKAVYSARFIPQRIVSLIRTHRPDVLMAIPSMYGALLSVKDLSAEDLSSIRLAISGGEPLPQSTFEQYEHRLNLRILEGYGLTETAPITNWSTPQRFKPRSVGTALPGVMVIVVDERDRPLPPGREGEVLISGPNVMPGYWRLPELTRQVFVDLTLPQACTPSQTTRFFRTGDIGCLDHDGFLYITGRKKEMLIIGGENVFPREIEEVLNKHPAVKDSAVIGQQDPVRGEVPIAFVELRDGQAFDETALRTWCRERLAHYKVPREVRHLDALPRSPTGKILRRRLQA
jgi:long-chain acyl-CoA synthetase